MVLLSMIVGLIIGLILSVLLISWPFAAVVGLLGGLFTALLKTKTEVFESLNLPYILSFAVGMFAGATFVGYLDIASFNEHFGNVYLTMVVTAAIIPGFFLIGVFIYSLWARIS